MTVVAWCFYLTAYQYLIGYLMPNFLKNNLQLYSFKYSYLIQLIYTQLYVPTTPMRAILANTPNQAETLLHSLEQATAGIGLHVNAHKTEYMCYNQTGDITTLDRTPLKLEDKFTYLGSSVSLTEKDIDMRLTKAWTAIIWKSDLTDKIKRSFF